MIWVLVCKILSDNKELNYKIFKAKAAYLLNDLDDQLFKRIFGYTFAALVDKLINRVDKKGNQIIIDDIKNNKNKIYREYRFDEAVIKHSGDLIDAGKIILEINKVLKHQIKSIIIDKTIKNIKKIL